MDLMEIRRGLMMGMVQNLGNVIINSGYLTIDDDTDDIVVNHNLGVSPDFAGMWVENQDYDNIVPGSCMMTIYQYAPYNNIPNITSEGQRWRYLFFYKHATSYNFLGGTSNIVNSAVSNIDTTFHFVRGAYSWRKLDSNGNLIKYRWFVGKMKTEA